MHIYIFFAYLFTSFNTVSTCSTASLKSYLIDYNVLHNGNVIEKSVIEVIKLICNKFTCYYALI